MKLRPLALTLAILALLFAAACAGNGTTSSGGAAAPEDRPPAAPRASTAPDRAAKELDAKESDTARTDVTRPSAEATAAAADAPTTSPVERPADRDAAEEPVSTFALDVDTASYGYARRLLQDGELPHPAQVRPEEFVNAFRQDYRQPDGDGFAVHLDGARLPEADAALVRIGLQTRAEDAGARRPANLTFVVDVSGSMGSPGRLDLVREALHLLVDQLGAGDHVSIVTFSDTARLVIPMTPATERAALHAAVDRLGVEGSTNVEEGLTVGYQEAARAFRPVATNRVILLSDGLANTGNTSWQGILDRIEEYAAKKITLLGVGVGREYGDELMEQLADNGDGAAVYISDLEEARKVFTQQLAAGLDLRARDAKAQVAFNPAVVRTYRLIGYENRALANEDFRDDAKDGGEVGPGHSVTALYKVSLHPGAKGQIGTATVRWLDPDTRRPAELSNALDASALAADLWRQAAPRLQVDVVAAAFADHLRFRDEPGSRLLDLGLRDLAEHARRLGAATEDPAVTELADLIGKAADRTE
ncbi:von Willebrand factor type A domain-containing protein [Thermopolyspora sp. NPDC052614]|uniref:vWA domain-containing protein n=1 Tax=Thermopolyspora sp. NPDC052614 TaxID=3155682 RepID=UPI00341B5F3F